MNLNLFCGAAVLTGLSQEPLFQLRTDIPDLRWLVKKRCLDIPFQRNASP